MSLIKPNNNIIDEPIPEINVPILKPAPYRFKPSSLKSIASKAANLIKEKINNFPDWINSYVPKPVVKVVNERVELLKENIKNIYEKINKSTAQSHKSALRGFLKTFRIDGKNDHDFILFLNNIKQKVINTVNNQNKPIKLKFIFTCEFLKKDIKTRV